MRLHAGLCGWVCISAVACRSQKRAPDSLEVELQGIGRCLLNLGPELVSPGRGGASVLHC